MTITLARLDSEAFDTSTLYIRSLCGRERISDSFVFDLELVSTASAPLDLEAVIGSDVSIAFSQGETTSRKVHGMVMEAGRGADLQTGYRGYSIRVVPRLARLTLVSNVQVFVKTNALDVIKGKLTRFGFVEGDDFSLHIDKPLPEREIIIQHRETDFAFISRLMEQYGLAYFYAHDGEHDRLIITDDKSGFVDVPDGDVPYRGRGEQLDVFELDYRRRLVPKTYVCRDYNYRHPNAKMQSERISAADGDVGGIFDYGLHFTTVEEGTVLARNLSERCLVDRDGFRGASSWPSFSAGHRMSISSHPDEPPPLLLVEVEHRLTQPVQGLATEGAEAYANRFHAIPATRNYRPPLVTPRPQIHGVVHAVVQTDTVGTVSQYAQLDDDGRYLIKFRFDPSAASDGQAASCRVRLMQSSAGPGYGTHFPLRPGVEVLVAFIDGNPDRPIIVGAAPNPITPSPVGASTSNKNRIRTQSGALIEIDDGTGS